MQLRRDQRSIWHPERNEALLLVILSGVKLCFRPGTLDERKLSSRPVILSGAKRSRRILFGMYKGGNHERLMHERYREEHERNDADQL